MSSSEDNGPGESNSLGLSLGPPPAYVASSSVKQFPSLKGPEPRSPSPGSTGASNSLWTDGGWNAGHFAFAFGDDDDQEDVGVRVQGEVKSESEQPTESMRRTLRRVKKGLTDRGGSPKLLGFPPNDQRADHSQRTRTDPDGVRTRLNIQTDVPTRLSPTYNRDGSPQFLADDYFKPASSHYSALSTTIDQHGMSGSGANWTFDQHGNLVNAGTRYELADEILDLQDHALSEQSQLGYSDALTASQSRLSALDRELLRRRSEPAELRQSAQDSDDIYSSQWCEPRYRRSESSMTPLQAYFTAPTPGSARSHIPLPPPPPPTPPLTPGTLCKIASLPLQTDPEDILYTTARETFVEQSLAGVPIPQSAASRQTMMSHFDKAMHASHPLASLYGLSPEAADALAANPGTSGISESVLRLALIREKQQKAAGAPGLPGPSPNNRKLALYKTELCRSWEERGVCRYGVKCQFAHGPHELRAVERHPKFKSEICRTFWLHGSCQYGARCCFIHTTVPGGAAATVPGLPTPKTLDVELLKNSSNLSVDSPSTSLHNGLSSMALTSSNLPSGFGPHLAEFLQPSSLIQSARSSSSTSDENSPTDINRSGSSGSRRSGCGSGSGASLSGSVLSTSSFVSPLSSIGVKPPGRFTNNPFEVPPTYQDQPQSRLKRLASLPSSTTTLTQKSVTPMPSAPTLSGTVSPGVSTPPSVSAPHTRHSSISSLKSASSATASSFMNRTASTSSLSSFGGSLFAPLTPVTPEWVPAGSPTTTLLKHALDWGSPSSSQATNDKSFIPTIEESMSTFTVLDQNGQGQARDDVEQSDEPFYSSMLNGKPSLDPPCTLRPSPIFNPRIAKKKQVAIGERIEDKA
ncbi:hypothetical protein OIV83_001588 [Microbotryomycetes sp. JL201]|nr:hypothetical protein OIV83_001588 [Microbotryomycetes sp. JL201]